jgi:hypothetical protein
VSKLETLTDFWHHDYIQTLQPKGRLAFYYAVQHKLERKPIIPEDMAIHTGLNLSEIEAYLGLFERQGAL